LSGGALFENIGGITSQIGGVASEMMAQFNPCLWFFWCACILRPTSWWKLSEQIYTVYKGICCNLANVWTSTAKGHSAI